MKKNALNISTIEQQPEHENDDEQQHRVTKMPQTIEIAAATTRITVIDLSTVSSVSPVSEETQGYETRAKSPSQHGTPSLKLPQLTLSNTERADLSTDMMDSHRMDGSSDEANANIDDDENTETAAFEKMFREDEHDYLSITYCWSSRNNIHRRLPVSPLVSRKVAPATARVCATIIPQSPIPTFDQITREGIDTLLSTAHCVDGMDAFADKDPNGLVWHTTRSNDVTLSSPASSWMRDFKEEGQELAESLHSCFDEPFETFVSEVDGGDRLKFYSGEKMSHPFESCSWSHCGAPQPGSRMKGDNVADNHTSTEQDRPDRTTLSTKKRKKPTLTSFTQCKHSPIVKAIAGRRKKKKKLTDTTKHPGYSKWNTSSTASLLDLYEYQKVAEVEPRVATTAEKCSTKRTIRSRKHLPAPGLFPHEAFGPKYQYFGVAPREDNYTGGFRLVLKRNIPSCNERTNKEKKEMNSTLFDVYGYPKHVPFVVRQEHYFHTSQADRLFGKKLRKDKAMGNREAIYHMLDLLHRMTFDSCDHDLHNWKDLIVDAESLPSSIKPAAKRIYSKVLYVRFALVEVLMNMPDRSWDNCLFLAANRVNKCFSSEFVYKVKKGETVERYVKEFIHNGFKFPLTVDQQNRIFAEQQHGH